MPPVKSRTKALRKGKRKKVFTGIRKQEIEIAHDFSNFDPTCFSTPNAHKNSVIRTGVSKRKLENSSFEELEGSSTVKTRQLTAKLGFRLPQNEIKAIGYSIVDMGKFQESLASVVVCKFCKSPKSQISIWKDNKKKHGLAEQLIMKCSECNAETKFYSSEKVKNGAFEVNKRSVLACNTFKGGRQVLENFCAVMNLPKPLAPPSFSRHLKSVAHTAAKEAEIRMKEAASRIRELILHKYPEACDGDPDGAIPVAISIDGTWHKRGFSSKYGVVVAILVETGEVIDFEVISKHCFECKKHSHDDTCSEHYKKWKESHASKCHINFQGSSGAMEGTGALSIFKRSIDQYKLKYTTFVGDGDSDTFKVVQEGMQELYGGRYNVVKEECIGHIQKRMGYALRNYLKHNKGRKLADNKSVGGKGRLTKNIIDRFQRNYGEAIRRNKGSLIDMQNAVWAIFHHMIMPSKNIPLKIQHKFCPKGEKSWCKFNSDIVTGLSTYSQKQRLPFVFYKELKPIFERLSGKELLKKCLRGLTQNPNESLNNLIWQRCPKNTFCGKDRIISAVAEAVAVFNCGASVKASMIKASGIKDVGVNSFFAFRKADSLRLYSTSQKISDKYKAWRLSRKRIEGEQNKKAKEHYDPGAFDSKDGKIQNKRKRNQKNMNELHCQQKRRKMSVQGQTSQNSKELEGIEKAFKIVERSIESIEIEITKPEPLEVIKPYFAVSN